MSGGTGSPIVSRASFDALDIAKSFTLFDDEALFLGQIYRARLGRDCRLIDFLGSQDFVG